MSSSTTTLPWGALRFQHTQAVRSALRQMLRVAWNLGYMTAEEYQRAVDLKPVVGEREVAAAGRAPSYGEWMALLSACVADPTPAGARDAALFALLKVTGLRRAGVAALRPEDNDTTGKARKVDGKRRKQRSIPCEDGGARDAVSDWLAVRGSGQGHSLCVPGKAARCSKRG